MAVGRDTIVVLRALGLGDLLTGIPALRGLRRADPDADIVLATPERFRELAMLSGAVDRVAPTSGLGGLHPMPEPPNLAVNLHGSGPQSIAALLAVEPRSLLSHRHSAYPELPGPPWRADLHEVDRWCHLLEWAGISCNPDDLAISRPYGYPDRSGVVVIHPGAAFAARRWPAERFAAVAAALHAVGHEVVITGDFAEVDLACWVARQAGLPQSRVLAGTLGLLGLVALISDCRLLICGDTGVGHIGTATGAPSVLIFGPTPPSRWGPRGAGPQIAVWAGDKGDPHADRPHSVPVADHGGAGARGQPELAEGMRMTGLCAGVVGAGYVGLTTAVCLAERDHDTVCVDVDPERVRQCGDGVAPLDEPGLPELLRSGLDEGTLRFSTDYAMLADRDVVFVCVPTPSLADGSADLGAVDVAVGELAAVLRSGSVLALKSTVPVRTTRRVARRLQGNGIEAVSNPEFLRESHAVYDFRHPDRIIVGAEDDAAAQLLTTVYGGGSTTLRMSPESAELAKYASNAFLQ